MSSTAEHAPSKVQLREEQVKQAEELLFSGPPSRSFAKQLYEGKFDVDLVFPYPRLEGEARSDTLAALDELKQVCDESLDAAAIDRNADIPPELIRRLGEVGLLGMTAPVAAGGRGFSQLAYCHLLEELGRRCSATSIFVNAHHSIGMRGLLLFGTEEQKSEWLPDLVSGAKLAAFALTEVQAGSDAANVQTTATPTEDGEAYVLNGSKRYITNGAIADLLTVVARTPTSDGGSAVTAFLVTPDMPGFKVIEPRMDKLGIRGTATAKLAFENMRVPADHVLGVKGKGLKLALTVLDFGRTTFGACCTGAAKTCVQLAREHAASRVQFGQPLVEFDLVRKKLATMAADTYAMEAMTRLTAGLIDRDTATEDVEIEYMLETAILKVWSTERLWLIVNDAFQIHGGAAYFTDRPLERILRDARINQIGEGANEVLTSFIGLVGMRGPGERLKHIADSASRPFAFLSNATRFVCEEAARKLGRPRVPVQSDNLKAAALRLRTMVKKFGIAVQRQLFRHREAILELQLVHERIATAAMELYASSAVLSRRDAEIQSKEIPADEQARLQAEATLFLAQSSRRFHAALAALKHNDDALIPE